MITKELLVAVVKDLTYKPGWTFAVEEFVGLGGDMILTMNIKVETVCIDSGDPITIDRHFVYKPPVGDMQKFYDSMTPPEFAARTFVVRAIEEIEDHEKAEWLKFDGQRYYADVHDESGY